MVEPVCRYFKNYQCPAENCESCTRRGQTSSNKMSSTEKSPTRTLRINERYFNFAANFIYNHSSLDDVEISAEIKGKSASQIKDLLIEYAVLLTKRNLNSNFSNQIRASHCYQCVFVLTYFGSNCVEIDVFVDPLFLLSRKEANDYTVIDL